MLYVDALIVTEFYVSRYFEDIYYFKDFENQFPAIVYNDALTSESEVSFDFENEFPTIVYNDALTSKLEVSSEPTDSIWRPRWKEIDNVGGIS
ncbi:hypothetical protein Tco_0586123 [Tanacetum coccineum]